jgi:hypothetical protein
MARVRSLFLAAIYAAAFVAIFALGWSEASEASALVSQGKVAQGVITSSWREESSSKKRGLSDRYNQSISYDGFARIFHLGEGVSEGTTVEVLYLPTNPFIAQVLTSDRTVFGLLLGKYGNYLYLAGAVMLALAIASWWNFRQLTRPVDWTLKNREIEWPPR